MTKTILSALTLLAVTAASAAAGEQPAGEPIHQGGMEINAVYLQAVEMEPAMADQDPTKTDIHLEADVHADKDNKNGFAVDNWIPYLNITYHLSKKGSSWSQSGILEAMVANDGPHYGVNVALDGPGAYELSFQVAPPPGHSVMRHVDKETGVGPWFAPIDYRGGFKFVGTGKKGGY